MGDGLANLIELLHRPVLVVQALGQHEGTVIWSAPGPNVEASKPTRKLDFEAAPSTDITGTKESLYMTQPNGADDTGGTANLGNLSDSCRAARYTSRLPFESFACEC